MAEIEVTRYPFGALAPEQFFILLLKTSWALNWQMGNKDSKYTIKVPLSAESDSELLLVGFEDTAAVIEQKKRSLRIGNRSGNNNVALLVAKLNEMKATYSPEQLTEEYNEMMARQKAHETDIEERAKANQLTPLEKIQVARGTQYVTYSIIGVNVLIYLLMVINGNGFMEFTVESLIKWGGQIRYLTVGGEWYRLITSTFIHAGLVHVAFNMYALFYIGMYLEPLLGRWRYLTVYLACGILASLASVWWRISDVGIGASGAIFGLYGVFLALLTTNFVEQSVRKPMLRSIGFFVVFNLAYGSFGNIDNVAHIGGLVSGVLFGYLYYYVFIGKKDNVAASIVITVALTFASVYFVLPTIKDDTQKFDAAMERFSSLDVKANTPTQTNSPDATIALKTISIPAWQQCDSILDATKSYIIPEYYKEKRNQLKRYVKLQTSHAQLVVQRNMTASNQFDGDIDKLQKQIKTTVDSLNAQ
jgi:rhomboid protease GluP